MKRIFFLLLAGAMLLSGCQSNSSIPRVKNHPVPNLKVEPLPVLDIPQSLKLASLCPNVQPANDLWGGLKPVNPMAECAVQLAMSVEATTEPPHLFLTGCALRTTHSLVIYKDGAFQNLDQLDKLQAVFAPIESADEALSYALLATGYEALYGQTVDPSLEYFQRTIEDTYVKKNAKGWEVLLFRNLFCGCGPHYLTTIKVQVFPDGTLSIPEGVPLSEDPQFRNTCVD